MKYQVSRLGLNLGTFANHAEATAFIAHHCAMDSLRLLTDYRTEAVK
ncbi:MAG: hypothetical protein ACO3S3_12425 [Pseudohongiellaceae bacterium]